MVINFRDNSILDYPSLESVATSRRRYEEQERQRRAAEWARRANERTALELQGITSVGSGPITFDNRDEIATMLSGVDMSAAIENTRREKAERNIANILGYNPVETPLGEITEPEVSQVNTNQNPQYLGKRYKTPNGKWINEHGIDLLNDELDLYENAGSYLNIKALKDLIDQSSGKVKYGDHTFYGAKTSVDVLHDEVDPTWGYEITPTDLTRDQIKTIQRKLGVKADGIWGPITNAAYKKAIEEGRLHTSRIISDDEYSNADLSTPVVPTKYSILIQERPNGVTGTEWANLKEDEDGYVLPFLTVNKPITERDFVYDPETHETVVTLPNGETRTLRGNAGPSDYIYNDTTGGMGDYWALTPNEHLQNIGATKLWQKPFYFKNDSTYYYDGPDMDHKIEFSDNDLKYYNTHGFMPRIMKAEPGKYDSLEDLQAGIPSGKAKYTVNGKEHILTKIPNDKHYEETADHKFAAIRNGSHLEEIDGKRYLIPDGYKAVKKDDGRVVKVKVSKKGGHLNRGYALIFNVRGYYDNGGSMQRYRNNVMGYRPNPSKYDQIGPSPYKYSNLPSDTDYRNDLYNTNDYPNWAPQNSNYGTAWDNSQDVEYMPFKLDVPNTYPADTNTLPAPNLDMPNNYNEGYLYPNMPNRSIKRGNVRLNGKMPYQQSGSF